MNITEIKTRPVNSLNKKLVAIASITIDNELIINDIKLYYSKGVYNIFFPNAATEYSKSNIVPKSSETRKQIQTLIIQAWLQSQRS